LLERKQIEENYGDTQMPTALMENLLEDGLKQGKRGKGKGKGWDH